MLLITRLYIRFWKPRHRSSRFVEFRPGHTPSDGPCWLACVECWRSLAAVERVLPSSEKQCGGSGNSRSACPMGCLCRMFREAGLEHCFRSFGFELQGRCSAFTSWRARKRDPKTFSLAAHNQELVLGHVTFISSVAFPNQP